MHRLLVSAVMAAVAGAATAVFVELPPAAGAGIAAVPAGTAARSRTPVTPVQWVAVPSAPGCERSNDRYACHRVTVEGTGVDCDPTGCVLEDGGAGWSEQMELEAVAGMYAADPPTIPGG
jgi:hypothetical protein